MNVVSDGVNNFALPETLVLNAKKDEVNAALEKAFMPKDKMSVFFAPLVINTGGKLVVSTPATARPPSRRAKATSDNSPPTWPPRGSMQKRSTSW